MNWNYIAGFFDGEGNIAIKNSKSRGARRNQTVLNITNKHKDVLLQIKEFLEREMIEAHIYEKRSVGRKGEDFGIVYFIQIAKTDSVKKFFTKIRDLLIVKKEDLEKAEKEGNWSLKRTRLSFEEKQKIKELYKEGKNIYEISKIIGRDANSIYKRRDYYLK